MIPSAGRQHLPETRALGLHVCRRRSPPYLTRAYVHLDVEKRKFSVAVTEDESEGLLYIEKQINNRMVVVSRP